MTDAQVTGTGEGTVHSHKKNKEQKKIPPDLRLSTACGEQKKTHALHLTPLHSTAETLVAAPLDSARVEFKVVHVPSAGKSEACQGERRTRLHNRDDPSIDTRLELR